MWVEVAAGQSVSHEGGGVRWWVDLHNLHNYTSVHDQLCSPII